MRDWQNGVRALGLYFSIDSTFIFKKEDIHWIPSPDYEAKISEFLNDANFLDVIRDAIMRKTNDTIFLYQDELCPMVTFSLLKEGRPRSTFVSLLRPKNLRDSIQDSTAWEQAALQNIKEMIRFYKNHPVKVIQPPKEIPDSMKNIYNLYMNNTK